MSQNRDDHGRYAETVPLDSVRGFFRRSEPHTAAEIAEALDISNRTALNKLTDLHDAGEIKRKEVGARAVVWYRELNPRMASEVLAEVTGRPVAAFEADVEAYPMPEPDELDSERIVDP